ncbi:transmembrane protein 50A-like isoform X1 [Acyrthosiphon pisum]|uniref:ACYPI000792 protein n=1 Tax=Acyrthosiphon pisum TaxID=7029 RepID=C4WSS7_ACYPI|nr:transmembrane protein 50A-like [Acyrthosiphon pisum]XP_008178254.1 transmembrane protein 50A-like isoform X1 [Acyrthosiphon pisum]XP_016656072.1 transmembrane protein 50A-like isoform X1 [Acyrthosiphon pisum]BAH70947.1 ACYPI000792 [Acyrthosiphon pisum]|eukprot:NP_001156062.1 transmembrane protein 50A-like [Acyrthosiphon pisum]
MPMDCMDNVNLGNCLWFEGGSEKRNVVAGMISGLLFAVGWWLIIDGMAVNPSQVPGTYHICGLVGTFSLFMINVVSNSQIRGEAYSGGWFGPRGARSWLFMGFVLGFAALIAACWIFFADFVAAKSSVKPNMTVGFELFFQNAFIFAASLIYKFGRVEDQW